MQVEMGDDDGYNEKWWQNLRFKWGCEEIEGYSNTIGSKISTTNDLRREYKQNNQKVKLQIMGKKKQDY